tara:strand:- start:33011 stop:33643 length:633 start_codon:yes stop_codon:yes gene_type:complete
VEANHVNSCKAEVVVVDFDDSFTFNIVEMLTKLSIKSKVINWKQLCHLDTLSLLNSDAYIFGPGPGHPDEYRDLFPLIKKLESEKKYFFGICLGHQLYWSYHNSLIKKSGPLHGVSETISIKNTFIESYGIKDEIEVQFYNSLKVFNFPKFDNYSYLIGSSNDLIASSSALVCTYQFHPESIGTSCPERLFQPIVDFLYNRTDGKGNLPT